MLLGRALQKYQRTLPLAIEIGEDLERRVTAKFKTRRVAVARLSRETDQTYSTAYDYFKEYLSGGVSNIIYPPNTNSQRERNQIELNLRNLALFYKILGIERNDPVIAKTKEINPNFKYS